MTMTLCTQMRWKIVCFLERAAVSGMEEGVGTVTQPTLIVERNSDVNMLFHNRALSLPTMISWYLDTWLTAQYELRWKEWFQPIVY